MKAGRGETCWHQRAHLRPTSIIEMLIIIESNLNGRCRVLPSIQLRDNQRGNLQRRLANPSAAEAAYANEGQCLQMLPGIPGIPGIPGNISQAMEMIIIIIIIIVIVIVVAIVDI